MTVVSSQIHGYVDRQVTDRIDDRLDEVVGIAIDFSLYPVFGFRELIAHITYRERIFFCSYFDLHQQVLRLIRFFRLHELSACRYRPAFGTGYIHIERKIDRAEIEAAQVYAHLVEQHTDSAEGERRVDLFSIQTENYRTEFRKSRARSSSVAFRKQSALGSISGRAVVSSEQRHDIELEIEIAQQLIADLYVIEQIEKRLNKVEFETEFGQRDIHDLNVGHIEKDMRFPFAGTAAGILGIEAVNAQHNRTLIHTRHSADVYVFKSGDLYSKHRVCPRISVYRHHYRKPYVHIEVLCEFPFERYSFEFFESETFEEFTYRVSSFVESHLRSRVEIDARKHRTEQIAEVALVIGLRELFVDILRERGRVGIDEFVLSETEHEVVKFKSDFYRIARNYIAVFVNDVISFGILVGNAYRSAYLNAFESFVEHVERYFTVEGDRQLYRIFTHELVDRLKQFLIDFDYYLIVVGVQAFFEAYDACDRGDQRLDGRADIDDFFACRFVFSDRYDIPARLRESELFSAGLVIVPVRAEIFVNRRSYHLHEI